LSAPSRSRSRRRALSRAALVIAATTAGIVLSAIPALAHITISPGSAPPGSAAVLTFHIPNEEASAYTTRVDMQIPTDHPIAQLLVKPVAGWTIGVRTITLAKPLVTDDGQFTQAVSEVIWSGGRIAPGQFQDFSLSADPLPQAVGQLTFKTIQTYSNGDVVRWIDVTAPGQPEPDHPAPLLTLTAGAAAAGGTAGAGSTAGTAAASSGTAAGSASTASGAASTASGSDGTARAIAAGGVLIGLLGLALAGLCLRRFKATAVRELPALAQGGNGFVPASAVHPGKEQGNGTDRSQSARQGPESRPPAAARGAPRRKGASGRRGSPHR
jgi:periplasmic copper chaperone A